jgi:hypothetical protein
MDRELKERGFPEISMPVKNMLKKQPENIPIRATLRLPGAPSLGEIDQLFSEALRQAGTKLSIVWANNDKSSDFLLTCLLTSKSAVAQWECFEGATKNAAPLWSYVTSDILLVFNLVASSMQSVEYRTAASGKRVKQTDGYSEIYQAPDAYYRSALDLMAHDQQKLSILSESSQTRTAATSLWTGDLSTIDVCDIMRSIIWSNMTGRLKFSMPTRDAEIYFDRGQPVHAVSGALKGDECLLSCTICSEGQFRFEPDILADKKTIRQSTDVLLLKGALLRDKAQYLLNAGLKASSILVRKRNDVAEAEFEAISASVASGSHLSFTMLAQKQFYLAVDGKSTLTEVIENLRLIESQWIPLLCRMIKADFVQIINTGRSEEEPPALERKMIDRHAIHSVRMSLRRAETGMFTYPAFLYFLEQESFNHYRASKPLSVVIVELRVGGADYEYRSPLPVSSLNECVRRISSLKRDVDLLAHYQTFDMALLLPDTDSNGASIFANRMVEGLRKPGILPEPDAELLIAIGIATLPNDVNDIGFLLAAAEAAKNAAQCTDHGIVKYSTICSAPAASAR